MQYDQTVITPKGRAVHIRNGVASDENHFDAEQESRYLEKKATSPRSLGISM